MESYQDLKVWQKAMDVAVDCYVQTKPFPKEESFGMTSQIRRAACSIPANIAEGWGRGSTKDYLKFLRIAQGSTKELETHLLLSQRVELLASCQAEPILSVLSEVSRMLVALIRSLESKLK